jgi:hypothetical protein
MADGADVFPYDPTARIERLTGLQKLRAIKDRELAGYLFALWQALPSAAPRRAHVQPQLALQGVA